jgi:hypothetical protein
MAHLFVLENRHPAHVIMRGSDFGKPSLTSPCSVVYLHTILIVQRKSAFNSFLSRRERAGMEGYYEISAQLDFPIDNILTFSCEHKDFFVPLTVVEWLKIMT